MENTITKDSRISIAASYFSIFAFEALKKELQDIAELRFIFTSPTFISEKAAKEKLEFYIPRLGRGVYMEPNSRLSCGMNYHKERLQRVSRKESRLQETTFGSAKG